MVHEMIDGAYRQTNLPNESAEYLSKRRKVHTALQKVSGKQAMGVGFAQVLALIPGVSRSGITMTAGLFRGLQRDAAARFSFYLSTPVIGGAVLKQVVDVSQTGVPGGEAMAFVVGIIVSGLVGYASIKFLLRYLQTHDTFIFVYYRIALGIVVYLAFWSGFR